MTISRLALIVGTKAAVKLAVLQGRKDVQERRESVKA